MIKECKTPEDFQALLEESKSKPVVLFKHSTSCPISASAHNSFQNYVKQAEKPSFWRVLVIENRPTSLQIAADSGVTHQSPQAILFRNSEAVWNASHFDINEVSLEKAVESAS